MGEDGRDQALTELADLDPFFGYSGKEDFDAAGNDDDLLRVPFENDSASTGSVNGTNFDAVFVEDEFEQLMGASNLADRALAALFSQPAPADRLIIASRQSA
ncbi:hypothetical protein CDD83_1612 [Cordyceps sp. RAO-2017]|nr:hypothetical protein CDD83_1612 [Cordyceps sp. RAO-2017]